jgi:hypothetical protein
VLESCQDLETGSKMKVKGYFAVTMPQGGHYFSQEFGFVIVWQKNLIIILEHYA